MSPVLPTGEATPPPVEGAPGEVPAAGAHTTTPAPTKVDAYRARGIRDKQSPIDLAPLLLRVVTAVFTLIAFAIIASDSATFAFYTSDGTFNYYNTEKIKFSDFFFFSYLLTVNVIAFVYAIATIVLSVVLLSRSSVSKSVLIGIFVLDQIMSYLLMSASTSAATGIRIEKAFVSDDSFLSKSYASIAFSYLAFFVLAGAALFSGLRAFRHS